MLIKLTDMERDFLIGCILMAGKEGFYLFDRTDKCKDFSWDDITDLFKRLGASEKEMEELNR